MQYVRKSKHRDDMITVSSRPMEQIRQEVASHI